MRRVEHVTNLDECQKLWKRLMPSELVSDLWEVRACFNDQYKHAPMFVIAEENGEISGFLPLSYNEETGFYNYFPGETWEGKTWLEQNRIVAKDRQTFDAMLSSLNGPYHLRYLRPDSPWHTANEKVDEVGYLFIPEQYGFQIERYHEAFSHKTFKRLKKELDSWESRGLEWRFDATDDFETLCQMNISRYGRLSYFSDERFLNSFRSLVALLREKGLLRVVTVLIEGEPAAIDIGSLYNGMLTMLAGGTDSRFAGIAKLINMHHMSYACEQRLDSVDFLCGDFNWKPQFHLNPASLYLVEGEPVTRPVVSPIKAQVVAPMPTDLSSIGASNA